MKGGRKADHNQQRLFVQSTISWQLFSCVLQPPNCLKSETEKKVKQEAKTLYDAWRSIASNAKCLAVWDSASLQTAFKLLHDQLGMKLFPKAVKWNIIIWDYNKVWLYVCIVCNEALNFFKSYPST